MCVSPQRRTAVTLVLPYSSGEVASFLAGRELLQRIQVAPPSMQPVCNASAADVGDAAASLGYNDIAIPGEPLSSAVNPFSSR
eukprot:293114-Rhodomonas_salina.2